MKNNCTYFKNTECEYFPCHKTEDENFNCLFCYCPLYALGDKCGGNFVFGENGIKDCSNCLIPHSKEGYSQITSRLGEVSALIKKNRTK